MIATTPLFPWLLLVGLACLHGFFSSSCCCLFVVLAPLSQSARFQYLDNKISLPGTSRQVDEAPFVSEEKQNGCGSTDKSQPLKLVIESKTVRKVNCLLNYSVICELKYQRNCSEMRRCLIMLFDYSFK